MKLPFKSLDILSAVLHFIESGMCVVIHNNISVIQLYHKCEVELVFGLGYLKNTQVIYIDVRDVLPPFFRNLSHTICTCGLDKLIIDSRLVPHYSNYKLTFKSSD